MTETKAAGTNTGETITGETNTGGRNTGVAVVGMACRYPDAASPEELWENAVAGRRAFRRLPDERMRLEDYWDADPAAPDRFYARMAAVIEGYEFDRIGYKIAGSTYRSTDLTHWLALDTATRALADAGFPEGEGLPRERTGVVVGNTLTGEFTRANTMRLRWPYVRRTLADALSGEGWPDERIGEFLREVEGRYKAPFPAIDEDTLAGGLSNTIAGRVCNFFDFKGGGYTVDGACSSSLLSVTTACRALVDGELDVAVAGGVDLSIDPFEIIGFAKTGALARGEMRVYDQGSNGFWPGEGCGMVVLMREEDAAALGRRPYARIAGWGISSDGKGSITRPEVSGYRLALRRAYERAGFGIETVPLFEGHGTGTAVGDATELSALSQARVAADPAAPSAVIGTVKGMIGHTKAAAGVAGLIKAVMALHHQVLPPTVGCFDPHPVITEEGSGLRALRKAESWPRDAAVRAGVTAMGFGGINSHIVLEGTGPRTPAFPAAEPLASSVQDAELILLDAASWPKLRERLAELADWVPALSYAQLGDLAATAQRSLQGLPYRAAVVVSSPEEAERRLRQLVEAVDAGTTSVLAPDGRAFLGHAAKAPRIGYLFPGQGSGRGTSGGALRRRFPEVAQVYDRAALPGTGDMTATALAQPRIVTGSMAGLRAMALLGLEAGVAVGHSLGEISALHWAEVMDEPTLLKVAATRGRTMTEHSASGTMAGIAASSEIVAGLLDRTEVVIAGFNGPAQTVVAGPVAAVEAVRERAAAAGIGSTALAVSHAFHSPLVAPAADAFVNKLTDEHFSDVGRRVVSTVTGEALPPGTDVNGLLREQITRPVLFAQALQLAAKETDLFIEVGPGRVLSGLTQDIADVPAVALDTDEESLAGLLRVAAAAFVAGAPVRHDALFRGRFTRPLEIGAGFSFFASPCEQAPESAIGAEVRPEAPPAASETAAVGASEAASSVELLRRLAAERAELPLEMVHEDSQLLDSLHLSSISVGQVLNQAAQALGLSVAQAPTNFANATIRELAEVLDALADGRGGQRPEPVVEGAASWARAYAVDRDEIPVAAAPRDEGNGGWSLTGTGSELARPLRDALESGGVGSGVLVCVPADVAEASLGPVLDAVKAAATAPSGQRFVLVQHGDRGAAGMVRTLRQEAPQLRVTIAHVPDTPEAIGWVLDEVAATTGFSEAHYDAAGARRVPTLRVLPVEPAARREPLGPDDVILVTGGGKGITAECALTMALDGGARLAVLGRSDPERDEELAENLRRMEERGVTVRYARADVTDSEQVRRAVEETTAALGPVTAVLHGAGRNEPASLAGLDTAELARTFAPKIGGLATVLDALDTGGLKLLVTFGSIIGRAGLRGEAHYATANEWLAAFTEEFAGRHPDCRCLCMEWSVWSGVGMGERLSVVEELARDGITAIHPDEGVQIMRRLLADPEAPVTVVISGRTGTIDTVRYDEPELPLLRFVDRPLVRYHGVELVAETTLSAGTDPYLADHLLDGNLLLPAVLGMEAMAQVAAAVTGRAGAPLIEDARFPRPIVVPPEGSTAIRVAAVVTGADTVEVVIRSAETGFAADHFHARLRYAGPAAPDGPPEQVGDGLPAVPIDPARSLYGDVLFQGARFHRLRRYHHLAARRVDADLAVAGEAGWFAAYLPQRLLLGDPGMRDALMHGNQVCVPHATLLPTGIDRIHPAGEALRGLEQVRYCATERSQDGDGYVYDVAVRNADGRVVERWEGLRLQAVRKHDGPGPWAPSLLGPFLERTAEELLGGPVAVAVEPHARPADVRERREWTAVALGRALGRTVALRHRADGRPEIDGGRPVSCSHGAGLTMAVTADGPVACDLEPVVARAAADWDALLGRHRVLCDLIAAETGEDPQAAATRVWVAMECLAKNGLPATAPLTLGAARRPGWVVLASGELAVATFVTTLHGAPGPVAFALLAEGRS
ncbi:type I polyketide synthase [Actinomadura sp. NEAU-AAG7]|uniref:type I polyketide synthase n=1 Tax=Actinomadura sp. NEAU-AAG7 TaxID=2839640 RepID=UPI001BE43443|nr:type I polyketide synthase [Actinomadura sp. NEAU-AAG7]MBT2212817.1 SDR family NAD(P)-dependent oxidoreductase [Actinomadura sp. NEAU-AAG7]